MDFKKSPLAIRLMVPFGLLLTTVPALLQHTAFSVPGFAKGLLAGVGLGLELTGFWLLKKKRYSFPCKPTTEGAEI